MGRLAIERSTIVFVVTFFVGGIFLFKLFERQVLEHAQFAQAAEAQSTSTKPKPAQRGQILAQDKDGKFFSLAVSDWRYELSISPRQVKNPQKLVDSLKADLPTLDTNDVVSKISNDKVYIPPILTDLDTVTAQKIVAKSYVGVFLTPKLVRVYPDGANIAPQVLGFVGADSEGKYGIESTHDADLRGKEGDETAKRDSLGKIIDILGGKQPQAGKDVVLTLDYNLQYTVETKLKEAIDKFKADSGSIIVMDPKTGAVLALAGEPDFDPNNYASVPAGEQYKFLSPAVSSLYEPGSVFKPLVMAMGIDSGTITPDTVYTPGGSVTVNGHEIFNANHKNFGTETATQALENSDNVWLTHLSSLLGSEKERDYFDKFGVSKKTGIDLVGEQAGRLPPIAEWNDLLRSTASFGQGVSTTVTQLAAAYSVIANGGTTITPHLVDKEIDAGQTETVAAPPAGTTIISTDTATKVKDMLVSVVVSGEGKRAGVSGIKVAGKTGTAQVPDANGGYSTTDSIGSFAGFFPADNPRFTMVVRLNNPRTVNFAESSAAPTFGEIATWMTNYYGLR